MPDEWNFILRADWEDLKEEPVQYPLGMSSPDSHVESSGGCQVCRTCFRRGSDSGEDHPHLNSSPRPPLLMSPSRESHM